jgi:ferric-dicitrate binding protein FerR (iron transport regulator)
VNDLNYKYRTNKLSVEELTELREKVNSTDDHTLENEMYDIWMKEDIDTSFISDKIFDKVKVNIDEAIGINHSKRHLFMRIVQVAAAVLLPVFFISTFYLYRKDSLLISKDMTVSTGKGERATVTLPDGTIVFLNYESKLSYSPKTYNKKERNINFEGEGYFRVHSDKSNPFSITSQGLLVKDLGTTFNLSSRKNDTTAVLSLEEGSVSFIPSLTGQEIILKPNQKAVLNQTTGQVTVMNDDEIQNASAWQSGNMVFRNTELTLVVQTIENNYDVAIRIDCNDCLNDKFTGTLPVTNLNEVLEILEKSYHLTATMSGKNILLK